MDTQGKATQAIGIYVLERQLGKGGMGAVYLAYDPTLNRSVAIKILPPELAADPEYVARFKREATSLAKIRHPNLVHIYAVGCDAARHYIAMEYIKGLSVAEILRQRGPLPHTLAIRILGQVLSALEKVHAAGIVHRDLKPGNIMIDEDQRAILMDFGLAKPRQDRSVTTGDTMVGTPEYMAPELAEGGDASFHSDTYALGIVLFEMLTGEVPFRGTSAIATLREHVEKTPPRPSTLVPALPPALDAVLAKALAKRPDERYASVRAFAADLLSVAHTPELAALVSPDQADVTPPTVAIHDAPTAGVATTDDAATATAATVQRGPAARRRLWLVASLGAAAGLPVIILCVLFLPRLFGPAKPSEATGPEAGLHASVEPTTASASKSPNTATPAISDASRSVFTFTLVGGRTIRGRVETIEGQRGLVRVRTQAGGAETFPYLMLLRIDREGEK